MKGKKFKIRYKRLFLFLFILIIIALIALYFINLRITNIYITGNDYFSDQTIIEISKIENYPRTLFNSVYNIKKRLISSDYIESAKVNKKILTKVYIDVVENRPLFYSDVSKKTVLKDGSEVTDKFNVPILTNAVSKDIYDEFLSKFSLIDLSVLDSISEVTYTPHDVDKELFLFTMNDGNYISVNIDRFDSINRYFDFVVKFNNHKGILYLDSGEYFKILDN